jgi:hypothetical protein
MSVIPTIGRLRQEYHELEANLGYIVRDHISKKRITKIVTFYFF